MSIEDEAPKLKKALADFERLRLQVEANLKNLEGEKEELLKACTALGVSPAAIETEISTLESQMQQEVSKVQIALSQINV